MAAKRKSTPRKASRKTPAARKAAGAGEPEPTPDQTMPSIWQLDNDTIESALKTGEQAGPLQDYFGADAYQELRELSREASARSVRGGPRVLILPGIMGSTIGRVRKLFPDDVIWLDLIDTALGHLTRLELGVAAGEELRALGVILLYYLKLKLRLLVAGYDAAFHPYDWRRGLDVSGKELAGRIAREGGERVSLVAHSMGGLVARWALGKGGAKCGKLIMLGTPNGGAFAPIMALRAAYPVVRQVGSVDRVHSPEELARDVFSSFAGLTQMFPARELQGALDLYDLDNWPDDGLRPLAQLVAEVDGRRAELAGGAHNMYMIAGVEQETPVGVDPVVDAHGRVTQFSYRYSHEGDGTVPLALALLPGVAHTYYIREKHGSLANNKTAAQAVTDLLAIGETSVLPDAYTPTPERGVRTRGEAELRVPPYEGRRGLTLSAEEMRHILDGFVAPDAADEEVPAVAGRAGAAPGGAAAGPVAEPSGLPGYAHRFDRVVVGRRRQRRVDLRFALGSIAQANARALALGVFRDVAPMGAALALDRRMDGAIRDMTQRRMFTANVGEIFMLPTGGHLLYADLIAFVGLGAFDRVQSEVLQTAAENLVRTFIASRVEEFATVVFGGGSGQSPAAGLRNLLTGFVRGLTDADDDQQFRRIIICEQDPDRYLELKRELFRLSSTELCADLELTFDEVKLEPEPVAAVPTRAAAPRAAPVYLIVRREGSGKKRTDIRSSLLTAGAKATVITGIRSIAADDLEDIRRQATSQRTTHFDVVGPRLAAAVLADDVHRVLPHFRDHHLVVVHDAPMSRIPWETVGLAVGKTGAKQEVWFPAAEKGLSHRYAADQLSVAKWLEERVQHDVLRVLLIVNPTQDLPGAEDEGARVLKLLEAQHGCVVDTLKHAAATRPGVLKALSSGRYDVVHYAGHAFFDEEKPEQSGLLCHNEVPLTGADFAGIGRLPTLMFFNACESARLRTLRRARTTAENDRHVVRQRINYLVKSAGVAEALMRGGLANFVGTYWPVGDAGAMGFASEFYSALLGYESIGSAVQRARRKLFEDGNRDWADYIFYGNQDFVLKAAPTT